MQNAQQTDTPVSFGAWVKHRRRSLVLTQAELARRAAYATITIRKIESDDLPPSAALAERLAESLEIPVESRPAFLQFARRASDAADLSPPPDRLPVPGSSTPPSGLPIPPTRLIGRVTEVAEVSGLLATGTSRLVTLTGAGGSGKTRLALGIAWRLYQSGAFPDGVIFVDLAPLERPNLVLSAIAHSLGLRQEAETPLLSLVVEALREQRVLLVLDNFEHLMGAAGTVAQLLSLVPAIAVLVTGRRALRVRGEVEYAVEPLPVPQRGHALEQNPAIELFLERAGSVHRRYRSTGQNLAAIAEICRRVDGLPLAIELAAARCKLFSPSALVERLQARLSLLNATIPDLPARQQTLRGTISWSHDLLTEPERRLFRRLAIFAGSFSLNAAVQVCNAAGDLGDQTLDLLSSLVDHNLLLVAIADGESQFRMLQVLREYAGEQLAHAEEERTMHRALTDYCLDLTAHIDPCNLGEVVLQECHRLGGQIDDLRAVLRWTLQAGNDSQAGALLATRLGRFWESCGDVMEGNGWLDLARNLAGPVLEPQTRAELFYISGLLAMQHSQPAVTREYLLSSRAIWQEIGAAAGVAYAELQLGNLALENADVLTAAGHFQAALPLCYAAGLQSGVGMCYGNLGLVAGYGGDFRRARDLMLQAHEIYRTVSAEHLMHAASVFLALIDLRLGELASARQRLLRSIDVLGRAAERRFLIIGLLTLAGVELAEGQAVRSARLLGIAEAFSAATHRPMLPLVTACVDEVTVACRAALLEASYVREWKAGRGMAPADALRYALET